MSWESPEADLASSRKVYIVNETNPGSDVAAEVSAALAAASLFFRKEGSILLDLMNEKL